MGFSGVDCAHRPRISPKPLRIMATDSDGMADATCPVASGSR
jgi:hypothetical protein